jgi:hypothetical protein
VSQIEPASTGGDAVPKALEMEEMSEMSDDDYAHGASEDEAAPEDAIVFEEDLVEMDVMEASMTAFGSVNCGEFGASKSAVGSASVAGDADIERSVVGAISAESLSLTQGAALAMVVSGDAAVSQGGASVIVAKSVEIEKGAACCVVAGDASVARSWVGFMAARNAQISDDSRVIIDTRAGLIIGAFLFGGLGLLAVATYLGARRIAERMPHLPHLPHLPSMAQMPHVADLRRIAESPAVAAMIARLRHAS